MDSTDKNHNYDMYTKLFDSINMNQNRAGVVNPSPMDRSVARESSPSASASEPASASAEASAEASSEPSSPEPPGSPPSAAPHGKLEVPTRTQRGMRVEYLGNHDGEWIPAMIERVNPNGTISLSYDPSRIRPVSDSTEPEAALVRAVLNSARVKMKRKLTEQEKKIMTEIQREQKPKKGGSKSKRKSKRRKRTKRKKKSKRKRH